LADTSLSTIYRDYIDCLNKQDWAELKHFVHNEVHYNGEQIGWPGYRKMLERDFREIPDLHFDIHLLICEPPLIASRLRFNCTPTGRFLGLEVNGRKVSFAENVFYEFDHWKVRLVWSVIDKAAIEAQLQRRECSFGKYTQSQPSASYPTWTFGAVTLHGPLRVKLCLPPWGPHVRFRRVQTLVREGSRSVKLRNSA
jgi:predicted ester cyclase